MNATAEIQIGDLVARPECPEVVCRVLDLRGDWAHFEAVKKDGSRNRNWRRWSGSIRGYRKVEGRP